MMTRTGGTLWCKWITKWRSQTFCSHFVACKSHLPEILWFYQQWKRGRVRRNKRIIIDMGRDAWSKWGCPQNYSNKYLETFATPMFWQRLVSRRLTAEGFRFNLARRKYAQISILQQKKREAEQVFLRNNCCDFIFHGIARFQPTMTLQHSVMPLDVRVFFLGLWWQFSSRMLQLLRSTRLPAFWEERTEAMVNGHGTPEQTLFKTCFANLPLARSNAFHRNRN